MYTNITHVLNRYSFPAFQRLVRGQKPEGQVRITAVQVPHEDFKSFEAAKLRHVEVIIESHKAVARELRFAPDIILFPEASLTIGVNPFDIRDNMRINHGVIPVNEQMQAHMHLFSELAKQLGCIIGLGAFVSTKIEGPTFRKDSRGLRDTYFLINDGMPLSFERNLNRGLPGGVRGLGPKTFMLGGKEYGIVIGFDVAMSESDVFLRSSSINDLSCLFFPQHPWAGSDSPSLQGLAFPLNSRNRTCKGISINVAGQSREHGLTSFFDGETSTLISLSKSPGLLVVDI